MIDDNYNVLYYLENNIVDNCNVFYYLVEYDCQKLHCALLSPKYDRR